MGMVHCLGTFCPLLLTQNGSLGQLSLGHSGLLQDQEEVHFLRVFLLNCGRDVFSAKSEEIVDLLFLIVLKFT